MREVKKGSTDQSVVIRILDDTTGLPETAVEHNTAGIDLWYRREGATKTSITEVALAALDTAHTDGGIEHIGDGYYRLDPPDAAFASGANGVAFGGAVTGMVVVGCYVHLVAYDPQDAVRYGLTALPNAAADAAGGLIISDAGGLDADTQLVTKINDILTDTGTTLDGRIPAALVGGRMDANVGAISADSVAADNAEAFFDGTGYAGTGNTIPTVTTATNVTTVNGLAANVITAASMAADASAEIADAVWDEDATAHQTGGTFGQAIGDPGASTETLFKAIVTDPAGTNIAADVIALKAETAAILADTDVIGATGAGLTSLATQASVNAIDDYVDTEISGLTTAVAAVQVVVDAVKVRTDNLPEGVKKNTALANFMFTMVDSADHVTGKTGLTVTATRSLDGGAFAACANSVTEISGGVYKISLAATDVNADTVMLLFTGTGADATSIFFKTEE